MMSQSESANALIGDWRSETLDKAGGGVPGYPPRFPPSGATSEEKIFVDQEKIMDDFNSIKAKLDRLASIKPGASTLTVILTAVGVMIAGVMAVYTITSSSHKEIEKNAEQRSDSNLKIVEAKFETTNVRIGGLNDRLSRVDSRIDVVQGQVIKNGNGINRIEGHLNGIALLIQKDKSNR